MQQRKLFKSLQLPAETMFFLGIVMMSCQDADDEKNSLPAAAMVVIQELVVSLLKPGFDRWRLR